MRRQKRPVILYAIVLLVVCVFIFASAKNRVNVAFFDNAFNVVSKPFLKAANGIGNFFDDFGEYFKDKKKLAKQIDELTYKNNYLDHKVSSLTALESENQRLRELLELKERYPEFKTTAASVVARDSGNYCRMVTIDKGKESGIEVNQAVLSQDGLVGLVFEVGNGWSKIQTILDPATSVGCKITRTGDISVTEGDITLINEGLLQMLYISSQFTILEGDIVETSGLGEIYPKGIPIGRINEIKVDENSNSQYATLTPIVDFSNLHEVLVITGE